MLVKNGFHLFPMAKDLNQSRRAVTSYLRRSGGSQTLVEMMNGVRAQDGAIKEGNLRNAFWSLVSEGTIDLDKDFRATLRKVAR